MCRYLLYSKRKKSQIYYLGNWITIVFKHRIYYWKFCVDVVINGSTPETYLRKISYISLREWCTLEILEQEKILAEIYLPQVDYKYGVDGKTLENAVREYVRATKSREFNQHKFRVN